MIKQLAENYRKRTGDYGAVPRLPNHDRRAVIGVWVLGGLWTLFIVIAIKAVMG